MSAPSISPSNAPKELVFAQACVQSARTHLHVARHLSEQHFSDIPREDLMAPEDAEEGLRAFLEKRPPVWKEG